MHQHLISDLSVAHPATALAVNPERDRWLILPYEADGVTGKMLWSPPRNQPPEVSIPLPKLGRCAIHIGLYGSGTWPVWQNLLGMNDTTKSGQRIHLRLSAEDSFDLMTPEDFTGQPRFSFISEMYWKTATVDGQSLILAKPDKEAYLETSPIVAYIRLVPVARQETFPPESKRLVTYFDSNFHGHFVDSVADVKSHLAPLRESDFSTVFWTTSREDSCYYPTNVGNRISDIGERSGVYPYWAGRDMQRMLDRGEDPLKVVCDVAHEYGLKLFSSYRRMTCRMPPFVFPIHPNAFLLRHRELWCADRQGQLVPHLSLAYPEVRRMMIALLTEQAENYDIDGVHLFFSRGVPFVLFEQPLVAAFQQEHGCDPRTLPVDDRRVGELRARFFLPLLRELRAALDQVGGRKGKRLEIALDVVNRPVNCLYYGMDVAALAREGLVDLLIPTHGHFLPPELGERMFLPKFAAEFTALTKGSALRVYATCEGSYWKDGSTMTQRAAAYYEAGVSGLEVGMHSGITSSRPKYELRRRLGRVGKLDQAELAAKEIARLIKVQSVGGFPIDLETGIPTCG